MALSRKIKNNLAKIIALVMAGLMLLGVVGGTLYYIISM